jgi:hypothetical protein
MNDKTKRVMSGLLNLSDSERTEVEEGLRSYRSKSIGEQERYKTELRVTSGPVSSSCPCCGR